MHPLAFPIRVPAFDSLLRVKLLTIALAALAIRPVPGDVTPQQATAAFKAAATAAVKQMKNDLQLAKKVFLFDLQFFEGAIDNGGVVADLTGDFFEDAGKLQASVQHAANVAMNAIVDAGAQALTDLAGGSPLQGVYPKDFYWGTGGALDKAKKDVKTQIDQLYKALSNRVRKTVKTLAKNGAALTIELRTPAFVIDGYFSDQSSAVLVSLFSLDIVLAVNRSELPEDGLVWLGGTSSLPSVNIDVSVVGDEGDSVTAAPSALTGRWAANLTDAGTRFKKGNYFVAARAVGADFFSGGVLSFR